MTAALDPEFLRGSELFENQPPEVLHAVLAQGTRVELGPGEVVFHQGDLGDRLFVVETGVLEVLSASDGGPPTPVAYLGPGEVIGELALLTGSPRSATVRSPERAVLFSVSKSVFLDLMQELPSLARNLCLVLARRLERTTLKLPGGGSKQLQGNLRFFDLATVIQTLIGSRQTGLLTVSREGQKLAEMLFFRGNIARARHGGLVGDDAVFQLFQEPVDGEFHFVGREIEEGEIQADTTMPAISLLMESVRQQDELPLLKERLADPRRVYRQKAAQLAWEEAESVDLAAAVWSRLKRGASLEELEAEVGRSSHAVYTTVAALLDSHQIE